MLWYERRSIGLGERFVRAVDDTLNTIRDGPELFDRIHRDVRRAAVEGFPYGTFFVVRDQTIHVIACMHGSRRPSRWQARARNL